MSTSSQRQTGNERESAVGAALGELPHSDSGTGPDLATEAVLDDCTLQLQRSEERQRVLLEINNAVVAHLDRKALFGAIARTLRSVASFDEAAIYLHDPAREVFRLCALEESSSSRLRSIGAEVGRRETHVGWVFDHEAPLLRCDLEQGRAFPLEEQLRSTGIQSYLLVPLQTRGRIFGALMVASETANRYCAEEGRFLEEVAKQVALAVENMEAYEEIARLKARLETENLYLQEEIKTQHNFGEIIGQSAALRKVLSAIETVAPTDANVLITGETGTGKELVARALHDLGARRGKALVKVNCAALPAGIIESELFGHERGAFTGAVSRKVGRFALADGGTLFLDEIADLPPELQVKLLRVLQESEFEPVGSSRTEKVDVRVIAATNRDLERALDEGRFRSDLYYRLNVFPIWLPPLRERKEDIPLLVSYFTNKYGRKLGKRIERISLAAMDALRAYAWPGNVRELENVIERAAILTHGPQLELGDWLPRRGGGGSPQTGIPTMAEVQRDHILRVLELTGGRLSGLGGAAELLAIAPTTLESRMKKLGIRRSASRSRDLVTIPT